ncbi:MAG: hypothetical protein ACRAVC_05930 [Trichormus sp.]
MKSNPKFKIQNPLIELPNAPCPMPNAPYPIYIQEDSDKFSLGTLDKDLFYGLDRQ